METVLLVDVDPAFKSSLESLLAGQGYTVEGAGSWEDGVAAARRVRFDLLLAGLAPAPDGAGGFAQWREQAPETPAIVFVPPGDAAALAEAVRLDAQAVSVRPHTPEELLRLIRKTLDRAAALRERDLMRHDERARFNDHALVARDLKTLEALDTAGKLATGKQPVLICGEWGCGKELLARWMHFASPRAQRAFVNIDAGASNAASFDAKGRVECAQGGTLYIDEVGNLDPAQQQLLVRLLRDGVFECPGDPRRVTPDVRVIASTSHDLTQLVAAGRFRDDLLGLLETRIALPALRERRSDVIPLARLFLARACREQRKPEPTLAQGAEVAMQLYDWPGNLRELANVMARAALVARDRVEAADLAIGTQASRLRPLLWKEIERQAIEDALRMNGGNRTRAAKQLGISLRTLQYRLKEWSSATSSA
jgi:DNA-binding NtrC family response regulator